MEKVILIALQKGKERRTSVEQSLNELAYLVETAGGRVESASIQKREKIDPAYFIGKGKAKEIADLVKTNGISTVIFDDELTPAQLRNLENLIETKIIDRTRLILDIFAHRARTKEGILQVELAQFTYLLPRLSGKGIIFSQQVGGIGTRGPGERELEYDRRHIRQRIFHLEKEIEKIRRNRFLQRQQRKEMPIIALVGYTNTGKSTLLNTLTKKNTVYVDDKLFATLDPTTRRITLPKGLAVLFTDTVGFIRKLPHHLVTAFRATLEEVKEADLIVHLIDTSNPRWKEQEITVNKVLKQLDAESKPRITVYNKIDLLSSAQRLSLAQRDGVVSISALTGEGVDKLLNEITKFLEKNLIPAEVSIPYTESKIIPQIREKSIILQEKYAPRAVSFHLKTNKQMLGKLEKFFRRSR